MSCLLCAGHHSSSLCDRLAGTARTLEFFGSPAYLTDPLNRIIHVNSAFARLVGDPIELGLGADERFIPRLFIGPFRDRLPRRYEEVSSCLGGLQTEIGRGALSAKTLRLVDQVLDNDDRLALLSGKTVAHWDGTIVVRNEEGRMRLFRETVVPITDSWGRTNRFHISIWTAAESGCSDDRDAFEAFRLLTKRQREVCSLYASGVSTSDIAVQCGITRRTTRDHIEASYGRLGVHTRVELVRLFVAAVTL